MKIDRVKVIPLTIPLRRPHEMAYGVVARLTPVLIILETDEGITGIGEASPTISFSEESQAGAVSVLKDVFGPLLMGADPFELESLKVKMNRMVKGNPFAKAAVEMALLDIQGKYIQRPLYSLLGGKVRDSLGLSWSLASAGKSEELEEALYMKEKGNYIFKIKMGILDPDDDVKRAQVLREKLGPGVDLRADINQGWSIDTAFRTIKKLETLDLTFIEQPIAKDYLDGMARLCEAFTTPIMVDESIFTVQDALQVIMKGSADILGLKVLKHGGPVNSKKISSLAEAAGLPCYLGARMETTVAGACSLHFGVSTANVVLGCEEFCQELLEQNITKEKFVIKKGEIYPPEKPGLGVDLDYSAINFFKENEYVI